MNTFNGDWISVLEADLLHILLLAEATEKTIPYIHNLESEVFRKNTGTYYTPKDVASYFWTEYFNNNKINSVDSANNFISKYQFVEPSAGSGILIFAFFHKLITLGVKLESISNIAITIIDINEEALKFIKNQLSFLSLRWNIKFKNIIIINDDFRKISLQKKNKPFFFFGNPPFVRNNGESKKWKNLFADFLDISLDKIESDGGLNFILPLSVTFSKNYKILRERIIDSNRKITLSNFDNIPDSLFKFGKPKNTNSNKANSQRCTILSILPSTKIKILSTKLQRWSVKERQALLSTSPVYHEITSFNFNDQFLRIESSSILNYLCRSDLDLCLGDVIIPNGKYQLNVAAVARNYIGIREFHNPYVHNLNFKYKKDFYFAFLILTSNLFYNYWRTVGDGFHLTKTNIFNFPISTPVYVELYRKLTKARKIWDSRNDFQKVKKNSGKQIVSYDFSSVSFSPILE